MGEPLQVSRAARGFPRRSRVRTALAVALAAAAVVSLTPRWWSDVAVLAGHWVGRFWLPLVLLVLAAAAAGGRHRKMAVAMVLGRRPGTPRMPLLLQVTLLLGLTFAVAVAAGALLWQVLGQPTIGTAPGSPPVGAPAPTVWSMQEALEAVKTVLTIVAGIGAVVALTVAYRRQRLNEVEAHREDAKLLLERFCQAAGLLGAPDASVRVAGVYAYAALANDAPEARQGCIDVLCTYLRQPYVPPSGDDTHGRTASAAPAGSARIAPDDGPVARNPRQERQVRLTIIRIIRDNLHIPEDDPRSWRGHDFDFTGAVLDGGDFTGATFTGGARSPSPTRRSPAGCHSTVAHSPPERSPSTARDSRAAASPSTASGSAGASWTCPGWTRRTRRLPSTCGRLVRHLPVCGCRPQAPS
ncbi:hypothetical protein [Micromonospora sp. NBRC 110038]|uniref:hypothetical protein n=1 Tax=Micromonospora sp. NBRC 110038 TaxID=1550034 RepID=UPI001E4CDA8A|nr:hypothetical protein [Micromonospora sp. NBRC 110038]